MMGLIDSVFGLFKDRREVLDLSSFNDPLALSIDWKPLVGGGSGVRWLVFFLVSWQ